MIRYVAQLILTLTPVVFAPGQEPARNTAVAKSAEFVDISFDDLKFEIAKGAKFDRKMLGEKIEKLDGKQVRIKGYVLPTSVYQLEGIKQFVFVEDSKLCSNLNLTQAPIRVVMEDGLTTKFSSKPITVQGKFEIREWAVINGRPMCVYQITSTSAK